MTKAEERRMLLQQQAQPQSSLSKAEQRRLELQQQPVVQPVQPVQPAVQEPVQPVQNINRTRHAQNAQKAHENIAQKQTAQVRVPTTTQPEVQQKAEPQPQQLPSQLPSDPKGIAELGVALGKIDPKEAEYVEGLINAERSLGGSNIAPGKLYTSSKGTKTINATDTYKKGYGKQEAQEEIKNKKLLDKVDSNKYFEYEQKLDKAKKSGDLRAESKYQTLVNEMEKDYKGKVKDWYNVSKPSQGQLEGSLDLAKRNLDLSFSKFNNAQTEEEQTAAKAEFEKDFKNYNRALTEYNDYKLYRKLTGNPVLDYGEILLYTGANTVANNLEGFTRDIDAKLPANLANDFNARIGEKYGIKMPNTQPQNESWITQQRQNIENELQRKEQDFDYNYNPTEAQKFFLNAGKQVIAQTPNLGVTMFNPTAGYFSMYQSAGNQAYNEAVANGATEQQAGLNKILSGGLEVATETIFGSYVDNAIGRVSLINPQQLTSGIRNGFLRGLADTALDVAGEGMEEVVSSFFQPMIDQITYNPNAGIPTEEELWQSFADSILPTLIMRGSGVALQAIDNYSTRAENQVSNSNMDALKKAQLINEIENGRRELIKQIQAKSQQIDVTANNIQQTQQTQQTQQPINNQVLSNPQTSVTDKVAELNKQGFTIPETTSGLLQFIQDTRGTNIMFDANIDGNGVYDERNRIIYLNPNSTRAVEFTLAHELGHDLKAGNLNEYKELQDSVLKYAMKLDNYADSRNALDNTYKAKLGENNYNIDDEMTNDILGQVLGNQEFLNTLAQEKPNVFQRAWNWIKNVLLDMSNTGLSFEQRRMLNKYEQGFRKAYQSVYKGTGSNQVQNSLSETPVQRNREKTLAATHNLTRDKLKGILELGGFPVPSIAISDVNKLTPTQFGDITVLFNKETINPKNKKNEVYDRDIWSPTFPEMGYNINNAAIREMMDENNIKFDSKDDLMQKAENRFFDADNLKHFIGYSTPTNALNDMKHNKYLKYLYAKTQLGLEPVLKTKDISYNFTNNVLQKFNDYVGQDTNYDINSDETVNKYQDKIIDFLVEEAMAEEAPKKLDAHAKEVYKNMIEKSYRNNYSKLRDFVYDAYRLKRAIAEGNMTQVDENATMEKVDKLIKQNDFDNWIDKTFGNFLNKIEKGIRNDKSAITDTGRRTFKQLHDKYTLANVVKYMTKARTVGGENTLFEGGWGKTQAHLANRFSSIEDIRNAKERLQSRENAAKQIKPLQEKFDNDYQELWNYLKDTDNMWAGDNVRSAVEEFAEKYPNNLTIENFREIIENTQAFNTNKIPDSALQPIIDDLEAMKNIPTDYFEAKPQRAVGLDEISSVLIPNDLPEEQKQALTDRGIKYTEYNPNIEGDREAKYKEAAKEVLFSKTNGKWQNFLDKNFNWQPNATKTNFLPSNEELIQNVSKTVENEPVLSESLQKNAKNEPKVELVQSDDDTLFSLSEKEQQEVNEWANEFEKDKTIEPEFAEKVWQEFNKIKDYVDFQEIKNEVKQYKDKMYGMQTEPEVVKSKPIEKNKYSAEINERIKKVEDFIADYKTAEGTRGRTLKSKDVTETIQRNVGKEPGNTKTIRNTIKSMNEDMQAGRLTDNKIDEYVQSLGDNLKATISDYYDTYKGLKDHIKSTKIYVPDEVKRGITDYNDFRKSNMGLLKLTSDSSNLGIDKVYAELQEMYPDMLPDDIINPIDQLEYLSELGKSITKEEGSLRKIVEKQYGDNAWDEVAKGLKNDLIQLRDSEQTEEIEPEEKDPNEKNRRWTNTAKANELVNEFLDVKDMTYVPASNRKQINYAQAQINKLGYEDAVKYIDNKINLNERFSANDIAMGELLIQESIKRGQFEKAQDLISDVAIIGTDLGQAVQALSLIARMTPEGQLKHLNKVINKINENIEKGNIKKSDAKKLETIKLDTELATNILKATNEVELQQAMDAALQKIADQMPVTFSDKVAEWRYLAMLANPRTHIKNVLANVAMKGTSKIKNTIQRGIETIASPFLDERYRTFEKATEDVKKFAEQSMKDNANRLSGNKEKGIESRLKELRKVFKNEKLERLRRLNSDWLSIEDNKFTNSAYKSNLAEYLTANGIKTQHDIDMNPEIVQKGIKYATEEAWKTTFHQASNLASTLSRLEQSNEFAKLFVGGTVPFKKTPINIAKTGASYSPLGLLETVTNQTRKLRNGDITANQYIDRLSQGLTGSALFGVGALLAHLGILKGGTDDEDYEESIGKTKAYSIRIGDKNYDISWLAPSGIPLLMGAELVNAGEKGEGNLTALIESLEKSMNPLTEMSVLQGIESTLSSYSNKNLGGKIGAVFENAAKSYLGQFLPTIGGQFNKIVDTTQRTTAASKDSKWRAGESFARQQLNKIPFASYLLEPKTDVWGNEVKRDSNPAIRAFEALINPGTVTKDNTTNVDEEILSLFSETGNKDVVPKVPANYFTYQGETYKTNAKDYTTYKKTTGQYMYSIYSDLIENEYYKQLEPDKKVAVIKKIADDAKDVGKASIGVQTNNYFKLDVAKDELEKADIPLVDYYLLYAPSTGNAKKTGFAQTVESINNVQGKDYITKDKQNALKDIFGIKN